MDGLNSIFSNPFIKKRLLQLPDGSSISADEYIDKYVLPKLGETDTIMLKTGKKVSMNQFINKYVFTICQRDFKGDFDKFYDNYVVDNVNDFFNNNGIDIETISKMSESHIYDMYDYYLVISRYIIYNDPEMSKKSIADIVGIASEPSNYDKDNVVNNLNLYFSKQTDKITNYNNRADNMLDYSSDNVISGLYSSFNKEPMVVVDMGNGDALISENGMHRYHVLRIHYLNELSKAKTEEDRERLREKYTVPVKMETIDLIKTYSNFLLGLSGLDIYLSKERDEELKQTGNSILTYKNKRYAITDNQLLDFLRKNLGLISDRGVTIRKLCDYIPSFNDYIHSYFPEFMQEKVDNRKASI